MELTNENYHGVEARKEFMGSTQFKDFLKCEKQALAKINGEVVEESTTALLVGGYIDAYFSNEMDIFTALHPEIFNSRTGELKSDFKQAEEIIEFIKNDAKMMEFLSGQHQVIMTGTIAGVKFKIKIDSFHPGQAIVDQKIMRDLDYVWIDDEDGRRRKVDFVEAFRYDLQGAIYQEVVRQNTGQKLPFVLAVTTKEKVPEQKLINIDQEYLDAALQEVIELAPRFDAIKRGEIEPEGCGKCDVCKKDKKVTKVESLKKLFRDVDEEIIY